MTRRLLSLGAMVVAVVSILGCDKRQFDKQPSAKRFAAFLASEKGRDVFAKHHYTTEKPE